MADPALGIVPLAGLSSEWLVTWVDKFVDSHEAWGSVPPCWAQHPSTVSEMIVLASWHAALVDGTVTEDGTVIPSPPAHWAAFLDYIARALGRTNVGCTVHAHKPAMTWDVDGYLAQTRGTTP